MTYKELMRKYHGVVYPEDHNPEGYYNPYREPEPTNNNGQLEKDERNTIWKKKHQI